MPYVTKFRSALFLLMLSSTGAIAGPITIDGAVVFTVAVGQDADPSNTTVSVDRAYYPLAWGPAFSTGISEGRSSVSGDFGLVSQTNGFQFDAFNVTSTVSAGGPAYNPAVVVNDNAAVQVQLAFTVTEATQYNITGGYVGNGTSGFGNLAGSISSSISNIVTNEIVYLERKSSSGVDSASYQFGDLDPTVLTGSGSGILSAGQYRFTWETNAADYFFTGGSLLAEASSNVNFQLGSYADVPEPGVLLLLLLSLMGLGIQQRFIQSDAASI